MESIGTSHFPVCAISRIQENFLMRFENHRSIDSTSSSGICAAVSTLYKHRLVELAGADHSEDLRER